MVVQPTRRAPIVGIRLTERGFYRQWHAVVPRTLAGTDYVTEFLRLLASRAPVGRDVTPKPVLRPCAPPGRRLRLHYNRRNALSRAAQPTLARACHHRRGPRLLRRHLRSHPLQHRPRPQPDGDWRAAGADLLDGRDAAEHADDRHAHRRIALGRARRQARAAIGPLRDDRPLLGGKPAERGGLDGPPTRDPAIYQAGIGLPESSAPASPW